MAAGHTGIVVVWQHELSQQEVSCNKWHHRPEPWASAWAAKSGSAQWIWEMHLRFWMNAHCLQRKLLGWKGRISQNVTVITICSWWKASSLMGGYPAWFLCDAHPLPVPVSNRKGLKQRREEHWLPGNDSTEWRSSRWVQTDQSFWPELQWVTGHTTGSDPCLHALLGWAEGEFSRFLLVEVICCARWCELARKKQKEQSLGDVKERDTVFNMCFVTIDSVFPPL